MKPIYSLYILTAAILWGSAGVFVKYLALPPVLIAWGRLTIPAIIFFFLSRRRQSVLHLFSKPYHKLLLASFLFSVQILLYMYGYAFAEISSAVLVLHTWPVWMVLLAVFLLGEQITLKNSFSLTLCLIGVILIYGGHILHSAEVELQGLSYMLVASVIVAILNLVFKMELQRHDWTLNLFYLNFIGAIVFAFPALSALQLLSTEKAVVLFIYGSLIGVCSFGLYFRALKYVELTCVAPLIYAEVISAMLFGTLLFNERLSYWSCAGAFLILAGISVIGLPKPILTCRKEGAQLS